MPIELTQDGLKAIFPRAPQPVIDSFLRRQDKLNEAGISHTRQRLSYFLGNIEHECSGFTIPNLTENTNYSYQRVSEVWPNRYADAQQVRERFGTGPGWQLRMLDEIYGNRMGNRPGTRDGSRYLGRGGPQWTGRDGYQQLQSRTGIDVVDKPDQASALDRQAEICIAFWVWKNLNVTADTGNFRQCVKLWNGGTNGLSDRLSKMKGNDPFIERLNNVAVVRPMAERLPGKPPTPLPPKEVMDEATKKERAATKAGTAGPIVGGAAEAGKAVTEQPTKQPFILSPFITYTLVGAGIAVILIAAVLIARKHATVKANWR